MIKFIYSEKATKLCKIFPLLLTTVHTVKSKGKILQNFVALSEYMNFKKLYCWNTIIDNKFFQTINFLSKITKNLQGQ